MKFTNQDLKKMIIPLFLEQLLVMLVGLSDTLIVSYAGEAAVSGVSLVNMFNTVFIYLFTALASGGAVVISQYIGRKLQREASMASSQLLMFSTLFSVITAVILLIVNEQILVLLFGQVEPEVMDACVTYLRISAYSYPAIAIYNAGAALYRSMGKTNVTMYISIISNVINVVGNLLGVFVLKAGVAGVAYPSLLARGFSAVMITCLCFSRKKEVRYGVSQIFSWQSRMLKRILNIALPNGIENGIFQLIKVALGSMVALFGTYQISANGISQSIWSLAAVSGAAMGPIFITVIGQCMGAGDTKQAEFYMKKLLKITLAFSFAWNVFVLAITPLMLRFYAVSEETKQLVFWLVVIHNVFNTIAFPFSGSLGNGLRAAGDVKFTMVVSIASTVVVRFVLSYFLGVVLDFKVIGIALAMCIDWMIRAIFFIVRAKGGKWKTFHVI